MSVKQPNNYLEFNNPVQIVWRKGTPSDPFVDRLDITRVANQRIVLLEIPDELYRVRIKNMVEINYERFIKHQLAENEFYVDYTNGFVYFHVSKEAETISIVYKGRGVLLYPSNRVVHTDGSNGTETLHSIIEQSKLQVLELVDRTDNFEEVLDRMIVATNSTREVIDQSLNATQEVKQSLELVYDAYETTVLIYMPYVESFNDIAKRYPNPLVGWTTQVYDTGIRYRWNGQDWIPIDNLAGGIPLVSEYIDGLMSTEEHLKLKSISENTNYRTIVFICPQELTQGIQDPHIAFPHSGTIVGVNSFVARKGLINTEVDIEKSSDFENWESVLESPIVIEADNYKDNGNHKFSIETVNENDVFRVNLSNSLYDTENLTVNIKIQID